jgi:ParB family chromosome partitioning protein
MRDLIASVKEKGIIQPIIVRTREGGGYEIVAGERRYRAAKSLGYSSIPVVLREVSKPESLELALVENIQRADLTPIEEATAFQQLVEGSRLTHEELAKRVGKDRVTVTNAMRLLKLPLAVQQYMNNGEISIRHALVILSLPTEEGQRQLALKIVREGLTSVQAEDLARELKPASSAKPRRSAHVDVHLRKFEEDLARRFGTKVKVKGTQNRGRIIIEYFTFADLERIAEKIKK